MAKLSASGTELFRATRYYSEQDEDTEWVRTELSFRSNDHILSNVPPNGMSRNVPHPQDGNDGDDSTLLRLVGCAKHSKQNRNGR